MGTAAVFFDVDGVLIDSVAAKGQAFADLFPPQHRQGVLAFHFANGGLNRVDKIGRMSSEIVGVDLTDEEVRSLVDSYSSVVRELVIAADEIPGASRALASLSKWIPLHAVSAVPTEELTDVLRHRRMLSFFASVHGVPPSKSRTLASLTDQHGYLPSRCLFVGDSLHDRDAALDSGIPFVFVRATEEPAPPEAVCVLDDLRGLESWVVDFVTGG